MDQNSFVYNGQTFYTGDKITCNIENVPDRSEKIKDAKIYIPKNQMKYADVLRSVSGSIDNDITVFICQNAFSGRESENKLGYSFSWIFAVLGKRKLTHGVYDLEKVGDCLIEIIKNVFGDNNE